MGNCINKKEKKECEECEEKCEEKCEECECKDVCNSIELKKCQHCDTLMLNKDFIEYYGFCEKCRDKF